MRTEKEVSRTKVCEQIFVKNNRDEYSKFSSISEV
jgi:hypothetical protein